MYTMIWGCFVGNKLGLIVSIKGSVNADKYISILHDNFIPYLDALTANGITGTTANGITGTTFQQDNARAHTCKKSQAFFKVATVEHGFIVMDDLASIFT